jgi:hypothetical protein
LEKETKTVNANLVTADDKDDASDDSDEMNTDPEDQIEDQMDQLSRIVKALAALTDSPRGISQCPCKMSLRVLRSSCIPL